MFCDGHRDPREFRRGSWCSVKAETHRPRAHRVMRTSVWPQVQGSFVLPLWGKLFSRSVLSDSLWPHGLQPTRLLCSWDSPGKSTGAGCHFLLRGIFPTQVIEAVSRALKTDSLPLSRQGRPGGSRMKENWHHPCKQTGNKGEGGFRR